jgi:hypothetical protein
MGTFVSTTADGQCEQPQSNARHSPRACLAERRGRGSSHVCQWGEGGRFITCLSIHGDIEKTMNRETSKRKSMEGKYNYCFQSFIHLSDSLIHSLIPMLPNGCNTAA